MNILNLVNRSLEVSESVKNSDKIFIFNGMNATSESLLQNLLFRLENHEPNSKIYIKQTDLDTIGNNDIQYSWYRDDVETSKAFSTALKFAGAFNTPIEVLTKESLFINIPNDHTSVIFIDTEGLLNLYKGRKQVSESLENLYMLSNNRPVDVMFIQGFLNATEETISISKSNPFATNFNTLTGEIIDSEVRRRYKNYMTMNLANEYDRAYMLSSKIMNVLNNYITENMKLEFSKSITNLDTLETGYVYFDKTVDLFADFLVTKTFSEEQKQRINKIILDKVDAIKKAISEDSTFYNTLTSEDAYDLFFCDMSSSKSRRVINYIYQDLEYSEIVAIAELLDTVQSMSEQIQTNDVVYDSMPEEKIKIFHLAFFEIAKEITGGSFTW